MQRDPVLDGECSAVVGVVARDQLLETCHGGVAQDDVERGDRFFPFPPRLRLVGRLTTTAAPPQTGHGASQVQPSKMQDMTFRGQSSGRIT
jgi:hypothetical protein